MHDSWLSDSGVTKSGTRRFAGFLPVSGRKAQLMQAALLCRARREALMQKHFTALHKCHKSDRQLLNTCPAQILGCDEPGVLAGSLKVALVRSNASILLRQHWEMHVMGRSLHAHVSSAKPGSISKHGCIVKNNQTFRPDILEAFRAFLRHVSAAFHDHHHNS